MLKILLVRVSSMGDVLHNMPVVNDLLRHAPDAIIDWVVEEAYVPLVQLHPGVRKTIPFALRRWRKTLLSSATRHEMAQFYSDLRAERYDVVLDTQGLLKTGIIMGLAKLNPNGKTGHPSPSRRPGSTWPRPAPRTCGRWEPRGAGVPPRPGSRRTRWHPR